MQSINDNSAVLDQNGQFVNYRQAVEQLISKSKQEILIISPYLTTDILKNRQELDRKDAPAVRIVVCPGDDYWSARYIQSEQLDPKILLEYLNRGFEIRKNCSLHSKIFFSDGKDAIIGSANLSLAAFNSERWETGTLIPGHTQQSISLYQYAKRLLSESKLVRRREINRWIEHLEKYKERMAKIRKMQKELDEKYTRKLQEELAKARLDGEALILFASPSQIDEALRQKGFAGLIKSASQDYKFCDYHLDLLLEKMRRVPVWLYGRGQKEVVASGNIVQASCGQIDTLFRSVAHSGYIGIREKSIPIDESYDSCSELNQRRTHVLMIVKGLRRLSNPIKLGQIERNGVRNPNTGPGGRYLPLRIFKKLD